VGQNYFVKQVIALMEPLGFVWALLVVFTVVFYRSRQRRAAMVCGLAAALIFIFGSTTFPNSLLHTLERPYLGRSLEALPKADAVIMLGGGSQPSRDEAGGLHLTLAADRIVMALELLHLGKAPVLVLGGAAAEFPEGRRSESETVRRWIVERGLAKGEVLALPVCRDTHDEARFTAKLCAERGWQKVHLVTSASHMRRAAATFRTAGVDVIAAPCNFHTETGTAPVFAAPGVPKAGGFLKVGMWLHEQIGWLEYRRRGWIK